MSIQPTVGVGLRPLAPTVGGWKNEAASAAAGEDEMATQATDTVAEPVHGDGPGEAVGLGLPTLTVRGFGTAVEVASYLAIVMLIAIVEYYSAGFTGPVVLGRKLFETGTPGDFGISNWWLGFVAIGAGNLLAWRHHQTPGGEAAEIYIGTLAGEPAPYWQVAVRQVVRFAVIYAIPIWLLSNRAVLVAIWFGTAVLIQTMPLRRAPWDLVAGTMITSGFTRSAAVLPPPTSPGDLQLDKERLSENRRARRLLFAAGLSSVFVTLLILWNIFSEAWEFVSDSAFSWSLLSGIGWFPRRDIFDISTLLVGTAWVVVIAMLVAGPIGLGVAFYLSEYASPRVQRVVKPVIEILASVPSVVLGFFAISFISPDLLSRIWDDIGIFSLVAAGIAVGILTVPIIATVAEDALRAVPDELREAAYGLGSRKVTVALRVVFPAALSGVSAAFIVGVSRVIGETMVVAIAAGGSGGQIFDTDPRNPGQTITAAMASLGAGTDQVAGSGLAFQSLYFLGAMLFLLTLVLNVISDVIVRRFREAY